MRISCLLAVIGFVAASQVRAQEAKELEAIMERLERLEQQNASLLEEVRALRHEISSKAENAETGVMPATSPPIEERVAVAEQRIDEHEQDKVGTEHKLPVQLTGMVLFNAFANGRHSGGQENPVIAAASPGAASDGATLRQTVLGLKFQGPQIFGGGQVSGSLFMDFFGGTGQPLGEYLRIRVATIDLNWKNTTLSVGQDKPILAPREPESLAQIGVSPLTGSGNLWLWAPQARLEQRFQFGEESGLRAQVGVYQTSESYSSISSEYTSLDRPALQGRFEFWKQYSSGNRIEIAPGFDFSSSHVLGHSITSHVASVDWLFRPFTRMDFTGQFFGGDNVGTIGGLRQGISVFPGRGLQVVHALGGWAQLQYRATSRLTFNLYGGQEDDRNADLLSGAIAKNQAYAANILYRLSSNVLGGLEYSQVRTTYLNGGTRLNPHYDLALAYLF